MEEILISSIIHQCITKAKQKCLKGLDLNLVIAVTVKGFFKTVGEVNYSSSKICIGMG